MRGQGPRIHWRANADGATRSIDEAVEIARGHSVDIPDDVSFFVDELNSLDQNTTARGPKITKAGGDIVIWTDLLNRFGKVPFIVRRDILESDEAIVAVIAHELHELRQLRPMLKAGNLTIEQFGAHTSPSNPGNLHCDAWDAADKIVEEMRKTSHDP